MIRISAGAESPGNKGLIIQGIIVSQQIDHGP
jgi:hypothetical protein